MSLVGAAERINIDGMENMKVFCSNIDNRTDCGICYGSDRSRFCVIVAILSAVLGFTVLASMAFWPKTSSTTHHARNSLHQVSVVFRHGDRSPVFSYPNDPHRNYTWPNGPDGALTKKGMKQLYKLGKRLRETYKSFISDAYQTEDILVRSSYSERCIMSAQALLAAFYQPSAEDEFVPGLAWRPVPVYQIPKHEDKISGHWIAPTACPRFDRMLEQTISNSSLLYSNYSVPALYVELSAYTGRDITSMKQVVLLFDTLQVQVFNGLELPTWAGNPYFNHLKKFYSDFSSLMTSSLQQKRLRGGPLLKEIFERMANRRNGTDKHKMYLYSGHDYTLASVMRVIGVTDKILLPEYGAALIFELHTVADGQDHEVKILYLNNTETTEPHPIKIPGCGEPCLLDKVFEVLEPVFPEDWELECLI